MVGRINKSAKMIQFPYEVSSLMTGSQSDSLLFDTLASLNKIGAAMNLIAPGDALSVATTLNLIVEGAIRVVPGASAVIYTFDQARGDFNTLRAFLLPRETNPLGMNRAQWPGHACHPPAPPRALLRRKGY